MTGYKVLSEDEFSRIKVLQGHGLKGVAISQILGNNRTTSTIGRIAHFDTLAEYRWAQTEKSKKPVKKIATEIVSDGNVAPRPPQLFSEPSNETLNDLTAALIRLAIAVESIPSKRKLF